MKCLLTKRKEVIHKESAKAMLETQVEAVSPILIIGKERWKWSNFSIADGLRQRWGLGAQEEAGGSGR